MRASSPLIDSKRLNWFRFAALLLACSIQFANAQVGNNNPTGPAGMFNGNIDTGCSYDPFTGNAMRGPIPDIIVAGGVGSYPLAFTRVSDSRRIISGTFEFGAAGGWLHSYSWGMAPSIESTSQIPDSYEASFPDGRDEFFGSSGARAVAGIRDKVVPLNFTTMLVYLVLADGGQVEFKATPNIVTLTLTWVDGTIGTPM